MLHVMTVQHLKGGCHAYGTAPLDWIYRWDRRPMRRRGRRPWMQADAGPEKERKTETERRNLHAPHIHAIPNVVDF